MSRPYIAVIRQFGGIGDGILLGPVLRGLKEAHPDHDIVYVTTAAYAHGGMVHLANRNSFIDRIAVVEPEEATTHQTIAGKRKLRADTPAIEGTPICTQAARVIDLNNACLNYELHHPEAPKHRTDIWCEKAGVTPSSYKPVYRITAREEADALAYMTKEGWFGGTTIGIAITAEEQVRALRPETVEGVVKLLRAKGYNPVTVDLRYKTPWAPGIVGEPLGMTMALLSEMGGVIAGDSGVLHMAGAVGTPLVGVFGSVPSAMRLKYYDNAVGLDTALACGKCWYAHPCKQGPPEGVGACMSVDPELIVSRLETVISNASL